jgi:23S rRNA U2552 (ribose-2'-O)-methylase RlmE/FtsJ
VIENAGIDQGAKVLDLGSGPGTWLMVNISTLKASVSFLFIKTSW